MAVLTAERATDPETALEWAAPQASDSAADPSGLPLERVEAELCTLAGQIAAATCRFLRLAAFDAREGWAGSHVRSCAQWLSWRCGMDLRTAREHVRVARALSDLPDLTAAFTAGRLSYSKVRAVTRVATPETEADLVEAALSAPASQVERLVRGLQTASEDDGSSPRRRPGVQWRWDDDGSLVIWGRLAPDEGARLLAGLTRLEHQRTASDDCGPAEPDLDADGAAEPGTAGAEADDSAEARTTDTSAERPGVPPSPRVEGGVPSDLGPALVGAAELACTKSEAPIHAPGAEVVVHVDVDTFVQSACRTQAIDDPPDPASAATEATPTEATPAGRLEDGPALTAATVQRLACDGRVQLSVDGPDGRTLDLGRRRRRPTDCQLTALWRRDHGCTVPGCALPARPPRAALGARRRHVSRQPGTAVR